jgi:hypothetical protein
MSAGKSRYHWQAMYQRTVLTWSSGTSCQAGFSIVAMKKVACWIITVLSVWPLSGGIDSCATSVIVYSMCRLVVEAYKAGNQQVLRDVRMVCAEDTYTPESPQEFSNRIFHICFMGNTNSSKETRNRARHLLKAIGGMIKTST